MNYIDYDVLNLKKFFNPFMEINRELKFDKFNFPSNIEQHIKLSIPKNTEKILITTKITSSNDIIELLLATDVLKRFYQKIELFIPYIPYGRQDRITSDGEPFSLKVFANLINSQNYSKVHTFDIHSDVTSALINNLNCIKNTVLVKSVINDINVNINDIHIISPDAGAYKKIFDLCNEIGYKNEIITCNKVRDINNGQIKNISININDLEKKDCYIIDDICSRGGTFIGIANELLKRNCGKIFLIVSHFESLYNLENLSKYVNKIYTTNSITNSMIYEDEKFQDKIVVFDFKFLMTFYNQI